MYNAEGEYGKYAKETASVEEGHNEPLAMMRPLPRMATGLGTTMSPSLQGQLATYVMQDDNEPLATTGLRATYPVQGNNEPLTTIDDWASTFDDCEGAKALTIKSIALIAIPYHHNEAPQRLR